MLHEAEDHMCSAQCRKQCILHKGVHTVWYSHIQWNLRNKTTIWAMKSGLIFKVVLLYHQTMHVYMDMGLNQSDLISKVVVL